MKGSPKEGRHADDEENLETERKKPQHTARRLKPAKNDHQAYEDEQTVTMAGACNLTHDNIVEEDDDSDGY
jgi:hypothetical protein